MFGYTKNSDGEIIVNKDESKIVKFIFKKYAELNKWNISKTKKIKKLLKSLKSKGYLFKSYQIFNMLKNEFYRGVLKYGEIVNESVSGGIISTRLFNLVNA